MLKKHAMIFASFVLLFAAAILYCRTDRSDASEKQIKVNAFDAAGCSMQDLVQGAGKEEAENTAAENEIAAPSQPLNPASDVHEGSDTAEVNTVGEPIDWDIEVEEAEGTDMSSDPFLTEDTASSKDENPRNGLGGSIIGSDDRVTIWNTNQYPYSAIANMYMHYTCGCEGQGTGFMVGPSGLVTAAHCLVCTDHGKTADRLTFYFGYNTDGSCNYYYDGATRYWYGTDFTRPDGSHGYDTCDYDYGYVKFPERIGDVTGWFGVTVKSGSSIDGWYEVAGYRQGYLKTDSDQVKQYNDKQIIHYADMLSGNSGCPIFTSDYYVVAINVADTKTENYGRRITTDVFNNMKNAGIFD